MGLVVGAADAPVVGTDLATTGAGIVFALGIVALEAVADLLGGPVATRAVGAVVLAADAVDAAVAGGFDTDEAETGAGVGLTVVFGAGVAIL
jgi:hypothetical protein